MQTTGKGGMTNMDPLEAIRRHCEECRSLDQDICPVVFCNLWSFSPFGIHEEEAVQEVPPRERETREKEREMLDEH